MRFSSLISCSSILLSSTSPTPSPSPLLFLDELLDVFAADNLDNKPWFCVDSCRVLLSHDAGDVRNDNSGDTDRENEAASISQLTVLH